MTTYGYEQKVNLPELPYEDNYFQLPDIYKQGGTGYINNHYKQNLYVNDRVIVKDHYTLQPFHNREYIYGGATYNVAPMISTTSGYIPQFKPPAFNLNYGGYQKPAANYCAPKPPAYCPPKPPVYCPPPIQHCYTPKPQPYCPPRPNYGCYQKPAYQSSMNRMWC